jgi:hypothetical protein
MPHQAAGPRIEPPVSLPIAPMHKPAATATADPDDDPDGSSVVFHGLRAGGQGRSNDDPPMANSQVASLLVMTAPAWRNRVTVKASSDGMWSLNSSEWPVVRMPTVFIL